MRSIHSKAYEQVGSIYDTSKLIVNTDAGIYTGPYIEKDVESFGQEELNLKMYAADDIAFCNTKEFSREAQTYIKTGKYTNAHPVYDKKEFTAYWDEQEKRCKEGYTLPGKLIKVGDEYQLQQIHITGEHYGYLNFGEIKRSKGFEVEKGVLLGTNGEPIKKENGGVSKKEFYMPDFWDGDYYFFKAIELCRQVGKHLVVGKARRKGYSYKNGWLVANMANFYRRSTSVVGAYDAASLFDDGTMNKVENYLNFINKHTDWSKRRIHNTLEHFEIGYRNIGDPVKRGYLSNIYTATLRGNPGGMRGKDADLLLLEEAGKCPNMTEILDATLKTLTDGALKTGLFIAFGTGGGDDSQWQGFEDLFYEAYTRNFILFENIWDDDALGTGCGYFHGSFMCKPGLIDAHGNSDISGSLKFDDAELNLIKHSPEKTNAHEMEEPRKPSSAFSRSVNNILPAKELDLQLRAVLRDPKLQGIAREGVFAQSRKGVIFLDRNFVDDSQKELIPPPVTEYPLKTGTDSRGCWVLWEQPYRDPKTGAIPDNLYSLWNDPYGISKEKEYFNAKDSLGVTYLYENPNNLTDSRGDRIIGEFVGRRESTEDYDEQMFLCCVFYNGKILYENDRGDVFSNAKKRGYLELLKEEPEFHHQKSLQKGGMGRKKGISIAGNSGRKMSGVVYWKNWLLEKRGVDKNGNIVLNVHLLFSVGLLKECLKYDGKRNADRVSCCIVGMFDIRETLNKGYVPENFNSTDDDDYFNDSSGEELWGNI